MENQTSITEFHIVEFSAGTEDTFLIFLIFSLLYLTGLLMNVTIITVVYRDQRLHSPLYLLLCNLSLVDICFTTSTIPNLIYMLLSGNDAISITRCFTQMYFFYVAASTEDILLATMAYDRYVAICHPLHYHTILNRKKCAILIVVIWISGCLNSLILTIPASIMVFCRANTIKHFYCEAMALTTIACQGADVFYTAVYADIVLVGACPLMCSVISYVKIITVIMGIKSKDGRKKAFSTCSSHLTVIILYFTTASAVHLMPNSKYSHLQEEAVTVMYAVVTPILNPLIYSLRNKELMRALHKLLKQKRLIREHFMHRRKVALCCHNSKNER